MLTSSCLYLGMKSVRYTKYMVVTYCLEIFVIMLLVVNISHFRRRNGVSKWKVGVYRKMQIIQHATIYTFILCSFVCCSFLLLFPLSFIHSFSLLSSFLTFVFFLCKFWLSLVLSGSLSNLLILTFQFSSCKMHKNTCCFCSIS